MTRLKIGVKIDAGSLNQLERQAVRACTQHIAEVGLAKGVASNMAARLNQYERSLMVKRSPDPITGGINTAKWRVRFDMHMTRGDYIYGRFSIVNNQPKYPYTYRGYNKDFSTKRHSFGSKPWIASGFVRNLASTRYASSTNAYRGDYVFPTKKSIMYYSHIYKAVIFRRWRRYSSGGHERYRFHIDNIIMSSIEELPDYMKTYAPRTISTFKTKVN